MAKYHKNLKYHKDTVEKHCITDEEIRFLKELQTEMNTQDTCGQADPRYWTIRDFEKVYAPTFDSPDGIVIYDSEAAENYEFSYDNNWLELVEKWLIEDQEFQQDDFEDVWDFDSFKAMLDEYAMNLYVQEYKVTATFKGFFLTQKAAEEHLKSNDYHYGENAHTYALTAWRSPGINKLWNILQSVDWDKVSGREIEWKERN